MSIYRIKDQVPANELEKLLNFLRVAWKPNHALLKSKALLDFQHYDRGNDAYNFIVAENELTGEYDALVGYIPVAQYDEELRENGDYWGAIWKRKDDVVNDEINMVGAEVYQRLFTLPYFHSHCGISLSKDAVRCCRAMRYKFGFMHQYYIINKNMTNFSVADNVARNNYIDPSETKLNGWNVEWLDFSKLKGDEIQPFYKPNKSIEFLSNRYYKHPIYHYDFLGLYEKSSLRAILVTRTIIVNESKVLRIVDALGKLDGYIYESIQDILQEGNYEYVDFLNYGVDNAVFREMGFLELNFENDILVLPNYYEPFERRNVKMTIVHKDKYDGFTAFKGDADQDRPNVL